MQAEVKWLVCSSLTCQPGSATATLPFIISAEKPPLRSQVAAIFEQARAKIPQTHVEVKTIRKHGIVQLEVPQETEESQSETIRDAYFFPEQKNVIDHSVEPTVASSADESNRYLVNLKGSDEIGAGTKYLKGVLVLHKQKGAKESVEAFDIDSPYRRRERTRFLEHAFIVCRFSIIYWKPNNEFGPSPIDPFKGGWALLYYLPLLEA